MANKRGISYEELRKAITDGTAEKLVEEDSE
jgi:hypothetical protein